MYCDLNKAFDTVPPNWGLDKILTLSIRGNAHESPDRSQCSHESYNYGGMISSHTSNTAYVDLGLPQESVIHSVIFSL